MLRILQNTLLVLIPAVLVACTEPVEAEVEGEDARAADAEGAGGSVAAPEFPEPVEVVREIPAGTTLAFAISPTLSTETHTAGDEFTATLAEPMVTDGVTILPRNAAASGLVQSAERAGRVRGVARMELVVTRIEAEGTTYALDTAPFVAQANTERGEDAARIGAGAGIGAAIGAAVGGGDGAALGAAIGGGTGTAVVLSDRGDDVVIRAGTVIHFVLDEPLAVSVWN